MPYVIIVLGLVQVFFLLVSSFVESPFVRNDIIPADGNGLNPLLRHPGMIIHPPMLYLGFVGLTIPYAFAMAALMSNQKLSLIHISLEPGPFLREVLLYRL